MDRFRWMGMHTRIHAPLQAWVRTYTHTHTHTRLIHTHTLDSHYSLPAASCPTPQSAKAKALENGNAVAVTLLELTANYFTYFDKTWMPVVKCWSLAGRMEVARATGIALDKIPTTNNHLEGFNSAFKAAHLGRCVLGVVCFYKRNDCVCFGPVILQRRQVASGPISVRFRMFLRCFFADECLGVRQACVGEEYAVSRALDLSRL